MEKTTAISLKNIGVEFQISGRLDKSVVSLFSKIFRKKKSFWALRNITCDICNGDILYIIGRNGAGKTTLRKVMAETLFPNEGELTIYGGSTSFVSMGLGFSMDLSGYKNMDISLRIMGFPADKLEEKKAEIIEFTELGDFIYEPVHTYSQGMKARLGFAVATSIVPDILIMDEVINAGDEEFRERCKERMESMLKTAKCVVVCTHNLAAAENLATKVMWIEKGRIMGIGEPSEMISKYKEFIAMVRNDPFYDRKNRGIS